MSSLCRVRFAPSPTGFLHVGNARTALYNWLLAKQQNGKLILRIEDTDKERSKEEYIQAIYNDLNWLGIDWDEGPDKGGAFGPYQQSEREETYLKYLKKLEESNVVYRCFCTQEELKTRREKALSEGKPPKYNGQCRHLEEATIQANLEAKKPYVWRFKIPENRTIEFTDLVRGKVRFEGNTIGDFVLFRSDGGPTFHFTVVVDDALMKISHVIRGEDHLSNTPKHILLFEALKMPIPHFAHLPMILGSDRAPLSKRHGITSVQQYREEGLLPEALVNYLALLGWAPNNNQEIFKLEELIQAFSLDRVNKSGAIFDLEKLNWIAMQQMKLKSPSDVFKEALTYLKKAGFVSEPVESDTQTKIEKAIASIQPGLKRFSEVPEKIALFMSDEIQIQSEEALEVLKQPQVKDLLKTEIDKIKAIPTFSLELVQLSFKECQKELGIKGKSFFLPIRVALTGQLHGPELAEFLPVLGKDRIIKRLEWTLSHYF